MEKFILKGLTRTTTSAGAQSRNNNTQVFEISEQVEEREAYTDGNYIYIDANTALIEVLASDSKGKNLKMIFPKEAYLGKIEGLETVTLAGGNFLPKGYKYNYKGKEIEFEEWKNGINNKIGDNSDYTMVEKEVRDYVVLPLRIKIVESYSQPAKPIYF